MDSALVEVDYHQVALLFCLGDLLGHFQQRLIVQIVSDIYVHIDMLGIIIVVYIVFVV